MLLLYFEKYLTRTSFINRIRKYEEGTVYERQGVKVEDFLKGKAEIPSLPEQQKIADFLSTLDKKIDIASQELGQVQEFKKGLLQQMFV